MSSRRHFIIQSTLATAGILMAKPFSAVGEGTPFFSFSNGDSNAVTLLHTNDLHNHLNSLSHEMYTNLGGFKNVANLIGSIKNKHSNVVLVDAGDIFCGNIHHQKEHKETLHMMSSAGYDAVLPGNRDYEAGTDYLQEQWQQNELPLVTSNYLFKDTWLKNVHQPFKIIQKGNFTIGIIGAGTNMHHMSHVNDHVKYKDPVEDLNAIATMLKHDKKCNLVICLSHLGYKNKQAIDDIHLAMHSKNIDVIIGGHSHTFMQTPQVVLNQHQQEVIINHAGYGGMVLGNMHISFDGDGNKNKVIFQNLMVGTKDNLWINTRQKSLETTV